MEERGKRVRKKERGTKSKSFRLVRVHRPEKWKIVDCSLVPRERKIRVELQGRERNKKQEVGPRAVVFRLRRRLDTRCIAKKKIEGRRKKITETER